MAQENSISQTAVIIVHWDNLSDTLACLDSLQQSDAKHARLIIVNGKDPGHSVKLKHHPLSPKIIDTAGKQFGFAKNNNQGITQAIQNNAAYCVLLNNDTTVSQHWLSPLLKTLEDQSIAFTSPKIYFSPGKETHNYPQEHHGNVIWYAGGVIDWQNMLTFHRGVDEVDRSHFDQSEATDFATGCCLAFSAKTFNKIGPLNQSLFMYLEDVEWSIRAQRQGLTSWYQPQSVIWHKNAGATAGPGSLFHQYFQTRNRLRIGLKYAPLRTKIALIKEAVQTALKKPGSIQKRAMIDAVTHQTLSLQQISQYNQS